MRPVPRPLAIALVLGAVLSGCGPDLDRYRVVGDEDGSVPGDGGGGIDAGPRPDGAPEDGGPLPGECGASQLLAAVEDLLADDAYGGKVARFELIDDGSVRRCSDLTGGGVLHAQPMAVAAVGELVVVATREGVQAIDPATDTIAWEVPSGEHPMDVAALDDPGGGAPFAAVGWGSLGGAEIRRVVAYRDGIAVHDWPLNVAGGLGLGVVSLSRSSFRGDRLMVMKPIDYAAAEWDPFAGMRMDPPFAVAPSGVALKTLYAVDTGADNRLAWTGTRDSASMWFYLNDAMGTPGRTPTTVMRCDMCDFVHAVPNPAYPTHYFAVCETAGALSRSIVTFASVPSECEVVLEGSTLGPRPRIAKLGIRYSPP